MQNSSLYSQIKAQVQNPQLPEQELQLKCPRCDSTNTKFCYYNNYNLSQPRHFCRSCKRYWTKGGALRNIPVGGGSRKNTKRSSKRPSSSSSSNTNSDNKNDDDSKNISGSGETLFTAKGDDFGGQFGDLGSLLGSTEGHFGNSIDGIGGDSGSGLVINEGFGYSGLGQNLDPGLGLESGCSDNGGGFLNINGDDSGCWDGGSNGWSDFI